MDEEKKEAVAEEVERQKRLGLSFAEAVDGAWSAVQANHPELPDAVLFVAPLREAGQKGGATVMGHHVARAWRNPASPGEAISEVLIAAECMRHGGEQLMDTILHEGAHALSAARGVADTSQNGRYHNGVFKKTAEELGLTVRQQGGRGFADTSLAEGTADLYADAITVLDAAIILAGNPPQREKPPARAGQVKAKCACERPRIIRVSPSVFLQGPIRCAACSTDFAADTGGGAEGGDDGE